MHPVFAPTAKDELPLIVLPVGVHVSVYALWFSIVTAKPWVRPVEAAEALVIATLLADVM